MIAYKLALIDLVAIECLWGKKEDFLKLELADVIASRWELYRSVRTSA
jgi:hypothetical protein